MTRIRDIFYFSHAENYYLKMGPSRLTQMSVNFNYTRCDVQNLRDKVLLEKGMSHSNYFGRLYLHLLAIRYKFCSWYPAKMHFVLNIYVCLCCRLQFFIVSFVHFSNHH